MHSNSMIPEDPDEQDGIHLNFRSFVHIVEKSAHALLTVLIHYICCISTHISSKNRASKALRS